MSILLDLVLNGPEKGFENADLVLHFIWYVIYGLVCLGCGCSFFVHSKVKWLDHTWENACKIGHYQGNIWNFCGEIKVAQYTEFNELEVVFISVCNYTAKSDFEWHFFMQE